MPPVSHRRFKPVRILAILACLTLAGTAAQPWRLLAQAPAPAPAPAHGVRFAQISQSDMKEWLTYLSSDTLQGRQVFTEGYGLAASYVADHLAAWHVKPLGDAGTYFQSVKLRGYKVTSHSSITVSAHGETKTFSNGDHVTFPADSGGAQTLRFEGAEFVGNGDAEQYRNLNVEGRLVLWMPDAATAGRARARPGAAAVVDHHAAAAIGFAAAPAPATPAEDALAKARAALDEASRAVADAQQALQGRGGGRAGAAGRGRGAGIVPPDLTTTRRVDSPTPPQVTADQTFFDFLLAGAPVTFDDLRAKAEKGVVTPFALSGVTVTITIDNTFEVVSERLTRNVVGMVEGTDPALRDTYVLFGAHLDHIGYSETGTGRGPAPNGCRQRGPAALAALEKAGVTPQNPGRRGGGPGAGTVPAAAPPLPFDQRDIINNGADDDGSGSTSELAIAKAFALGPKPKRSVVFIWHTGEEAGLYGSRYNADFPVVPLDKVQAQLNMDMVGRDDCNDLEGDYRNSVFVIGADRISTDLHNIIVEQNRTLRPPLTLDYEMNDPSDPESVYTRSDHYSYASKGIPIAFFTTGLHPDYHRVSDTVDKILFPKMARIAQLVYETGFSIADTDRVLARDNKGPRTGFGSKAEVIK
jgi:hypothetical protein